MEDFLIKFLRIDWKLQILIVAGTATVTAIIIALSVALPVYVHLTGLEASKGFVDTVLIAATFTAMVVAFPIVSLLVQLAQILKKKEALAVASQEVALRKNDIFQSLLDSSVAMQRTDKLVALIDGMLTRLDSLLPGYQFGIIVDSGRPQMVRSFSSRNISETEKQFLIENNEILLGSVTYESSDKHKFNRFADWVIFPMFGRGGMTVGKLVVKGDIIRDDDEEMLRIFLEQLTAATENKLLTIELEKLANTDQLTGLFNRNYFQMEIERQIELKRKNEVTDFTVVLIDINGLKPTNDNIGHVAGDILIAKAADLLKSVCRKEDWVCRVGGDEFVILCPGTKAKHAKIIFDRITEGCKGSMVDVKDSNDEDIKIPLSMSVGYASSGEVDAASVYNLADERMYVDKRRHYAQKEQEENPA